MLIFPLNCFVHYFYWFSSIYVTIKLLNTLYYLISVYLLPRLKIHDFKKYGQWAVITGATDGIGKGFAEQLASKGVDICLISRNEVRLQNTAKEIESQYGVKTRYIVADFTNPDIYDHVEKNLDGLDIGILVNNVGGAAEKLEIFTVQRRQLHREILQLNLFSIVMMTSIVASTMVAKRRGLIINISSVGGELLVPYACIYSGSKHFINGFGGSLSEELKEHNVQVTTLTSAFVRTKLMNKHSFVDDWLVYIPGLVINVKELIESALITISSGCSMTCGYLAHEFYLAILKRIPTSLSTKLTKISIQKNK